MDANKKKAAGDYRSEVMQARLLDATLAVIAQEGWAGASTPKICKQAKVSRGAQTHHFPTKDSLLLAAMDRLTRQYLELIHQRMANLGDNQRPLRAFLEVMWESMLDEHYLPSAIEAMVAARTDPELRKPAADLDNEVVDSIRRLAADISASQGSVDRVRDAVELSLYLFRGLVLQRGIHDEDKYRGRLFEVWCDLIEKALDGDLKPQSA
jgi:AcrR family transcriptional regulator